MSHRWFIRRRLRTRRAVLAASGLVAVSLSLPGGARSAVSQLAANEQALILFEPDERALPSGVAINDRTMVALRTVMEQRLHAAGMEGVAVRRRGERRIEVSVPDAARRAEVVALVGKRGRLEF